MSLHAFTCRVYGSAATRLQPAVIEMMLEAVRVSVSAQVPHPSRDCCAGCIDSAPPSGFRGLHIVATGRSHSCCVCIPVTAEYSINMGVVAYHLPDADIQETG